MIIYDLELENYGIIQAVHIDTGGKPVVELAGLNAAGKSTILNAIEVVFLGNKKLPEQPIKHGQKEAVITVSTERFRVTKKITAKGRKMLEVVDMETGEQLSSPQTFLTGLLRSENGNSIATDPSAFVNMKPKERTDAILDAIGVGEKVFDLDREIKEEYEGRRDLNRDVDKLKKKRADRVFDESLPAEIISVTDLTERLEDTMAVERGERSKKDIEEQITALQGKLAVVDAALEGLIKRVGTDTTDLVNDELEAAGETNLKIAENLQFRELEKELQEAEANAAEADEGLQELLQQKSALLDPKKLPLENLSFDSDGLLMVNGVPYDQASQAEKYEVATALAFAINPKLKVVLLRHGGLIGDDILTRMEAVAVESGGQLWVERPLRNKGHYTAAAADGAVIIEAGVVIEVDDDDDDVFTPAEIADKMVDIAQKAIDELAHEPRKEKKPAAKKKRAAKSDLPF